MKVLLISGLAACVSFFGVSVLGEEKSLTPQETVEALAGDLKAKSFDKIMARIYFSKGQELPAIDDRTKQRLLAGLSESLKCLLKGKIASANETENLSIVTAYELTQDGKPSADLKSIFLVKPGKEWKISPTLFTAIGIEGLSEESQKKQFDSLQAWLDKETDAHSRKFCPTMAIEKKQLPYEKTISLGKGSALLIVLPDKKTLAIWCESNRFRRHVNGEALSLSYGERPFKTPDIDWVPQKGGGRASGAYKSYIRSGGVITSSNTAGTEYILFVGGTHRVSLKTADVHKGKLPVVVSIREAAGAERVDAKKQVDYWVDELKHKDASRRKRAVEELWSSLRLGDTYATPRWGYILEKLRPLSKDPDAEVKKLTEEALQALGDLSSILKVISPEPKGETLTEHTATSLGDSTKTSKDEQGKKKVYDHVKTLLDSNNPKLRAFAVNFFAYSDKIPSIREKLIAAQKDPSAEVRMAAVTAMEQLYPEKDIPKHRIPMLNDKSPEVVIHILYSSVGYGEIRELPLTAVERFIHSKNKRIRKAAINAISHKDSARSEAILLPLTHEKDNDIREAAVCALYGEKTDKVYQRFLELLEDDEPTIRRRVLDGFYFDDYFQAIPHIRKHLTTEKDEEVLSRGKKSLAKLEKRKLRRR